MDIQKHFEKKNSIEQILTKKLSKREVQVLSLYATGFSIEDISKILVLSESTVYTHIKNVFEKIRIDSSADVKITLCLFWHMFRKEITKIGGYKKC